MINLKKRSVDQKSQTKPMPNFTEDIESIGATINEPSPSQLRGAKFPTWGDLLAILGIFMIVQLTTLFIFSLMGLTTGTPDGFEELEPTARRIAEFKMGEMIFYWSIISQPLMLISVIAYRLVRGGQRNLIRHSMRGFDPTILLWGLIMILSMEVVLEPLMQQLPPSPIPSGRGLYMLLSLVVVAPLFEEFLCRGVILESIRRRRGAVAGCVISAMIFGIMHFELQSVLNAFVIGVLLGYLYLRTRSIFAPIILHSLNNVLAYFLLIFGLADTSISQLVQNEFVYSIIYVASAIILLISFISISRYITKLDRAEKAAKAIKNQL